MKHNLAVQAELQATAVAHAGQLWHLLVVVLL